MPDQANTFVAVDILNAQRAISMSPLQKSSRRGLDSPDIMSEVVVI